MTTENFNKMAKEQFDYCYSLICKKGNEYTPDNNDRFEAFKAAALLQGETPQQALAGMMAKHTVSIYDLIRLGSSDLAIWEEKITDHINYLLLLKGLLMDEYGGQNE